MMSDRTTAEYMVMVIGAVLTLLGVVGLIVNPDFSTGSSISAEELVLFDVNGYSSLLHLISGLVAVYAVIEPGMVRRLAVAAGVVYAALAIWSLFDESILGMLPVNDPTAILYAAIGVVALTIGLGPDRDGA